MRAFTDTPVSKPELIASLEAGDARADAADYESLYGIPGALARLEDTLCRTLPEPAASAFPLRLANAVPVGADLSLVWPKFALWLLTDPADGVVQFAPEPGKQTIYAVAGLFASRIAGETPTAQQRELAVAGIDATSTDARWSDACVYAHNAFSAAFMYADDAMDAAQQAHQDAGRDVRQAQADRLIELIETALTEPVETA